MDLFLQLRSAQGDRFIASRTSHSRSTPPPHPINLRNHARLQCRTTALRLNSILSPPSRQGGYCVNRETPRLHGRFSLLIGVWAHKSPSMGILPRSQQFISAKRTEHAPFASRSPECAGSPSTKPRRRSRPLPAAAPSYPPRQAFLHSPVIVTWITERISTRGQTSGKKVVGHGIPDLARALSCRCFLSSASPRIRTPCDL